MHEFCCPVGIQTEESRVVIMTGICHLSHLVPCLLQVFCILLLLLFLLLILITMV